MSVLPPKRRLLWQIFPSYLLITVFCLFAVTWYMTQVVGTMFFNRTTEILVSRAALLEDLLSPMMLEKHPEQLQPVVDRLAKKINLEVIVIDATGQVLASSVNTDQLGWRALGYPEIRYALQGRPTYQVHESILQKTKMIFYATPFVDTEGNIIGALRVGIPYRTVKVPLDQLYSKLFYAGLVVAFLSAILSLIISHNITQPIALLKKGAERFAKGHLDEKMPVPNTEEMASLAIAMNEMATQLDSKLQTIDHQNREKAVILKSMVAGLLLIDPDKKIAMVNDAVTHLLNRSEKELLGMSITDLIPNEDFQRVLEQAARQSEPIETEICLDAEHHVYFQVETNQLQDAQRNISGTVVILHDISRLKELENIRKEFVANVSHELRTPITSIRGFVETLLEGAKDKPEDLEHFLSIIHRQSLRLEAIIEDILRLSRVERDSDYEAFERTLQKIQPVIEDAIQACEMKANEKAITIRFRCPPGVEAKINRHMIEQALINLIENAIKYSPERTTVRVEVYALPQTIRIDVLDQGPGIASQHHGRLFERFYRVDKARSRRLGGTGLGLAIVKHIISAHDGQITLKSAPGEGSQFTIYLPRD